MVGHGASLLTVITLGLQTISSDASDIAVRVGPWPTALEIKTSVSPEPRIRIRLMPCFTMIGDAVGQGPTLRIPEFFGDEGKV